MHRRKFDFEEEENILIEKATKRKEEEQLKKINREKTYSLRLNITSKYFLHMSSVNKGKFIMKLLDNFNISHVLEIASFVSLGDAKPFVYASVQHQTNFKFDKFLMDHNRCLNEKELQEAIENDVKWFSTLNADQQVYLIISLIKQAGGNVQKNLFLRILKKCHHKNQTRHMGTVVQEVDLNRDSESDKVKYYESKDTLIFFDHPATIDVENQRRYWNQMINRYREKVQGIKQPLAKEKTDKEKGKKTKESKKGDKGKDVGSTDWIQLLPVWSVKKIFNYFDQKTLQKLKKVNSYWSYIAQDVMKERKMRIQLDKEIERLKIEIGPKILVEDDEREQMREAERRLAPKEKKKRFINYERGAIVKKLVPKPTDTMVQTSLAVDLMKEVTEEYFTENLASFPRELAGGEATYKYQPCFLRDVHVVIGDQQDINEQKSFVTYSIDTQSASLTLPVDRQTLDEW